MNQEFKNLDMLMETLKENLKNENFGASKTIVNIYYDMLPNTIVILNTTLKGWYSGSERSVLKSHLKDFKELNSEIIKKGIPKLIANGEFKSLHSLQYIQQEMQGFIKTLESVPESTPQHVYTGEQSNGKTRTLLDLSIKTGSLITQVKEDLRGTGKTTELIKKANELDVTLIVGRHNVKKLVDEKAQELGFKIDCRYAQNANTLRGYKFNNNKFLVDDSVPNVTIRELIDYGYEFVGGFNSLSDSLNIHKKQTTLEYLHKKLDDAINEVNVANLMCNGRALSLAQYSGLKYRIAVLEELVKELT